MQRSLLCVGLDPDLNKIPSGVTPLEFLRGVIDVTIDLVCAYKLQKAFFDLLDKTVLIETISYIHAKNRNMPVIVDCKIGDIENTMQAYLDNIFGNFNADGVVVNPYMGDEVMSFAKEYPDKIFVVLVKTSGNGSNIVQDVPLLNNIPLWEYVLGLVTGRWNKVGNLIPIISSTQGLNYKKIRRLIPDDMPILFAGVGAQGGTIKEVGKLLNEERSGIFINSSRGILYPKIVSNETWQEAVRNSALDLKNKLERVRYE